MKIDLANEIHCLKLLDFMFVTNDNENMYKLFLCYALHFKFIPSTSIFNFTIIKNGV